MGAKTAGARRLAPLLFQNRPTAPLSQRIWGTLKVFAKAMKTPKSGPLKGFRLPDCTKKPSQPHSAKVDIVEFVSSLLL